jgi:uncharacterized membrane protein YhaH (DUF805 family)
LDNIYSAPAADMTATVASDETYTPQLLSIHGRIGRLRMLAYPLGAGLVFTLAFMVLVVAGLANSTAGTIVLGLLYLPMFAISFIYTIRRLNDLNHSGWLSLLMLVPFVNFLFFLYLWIAPGTAGPNDYGPAPGPNTRWVVVGAMFVPAVFVLGIVAAIAIPSYMGYSGARSTQSQKL